MMMMINSATNADITESNERKTCLNFIRHYQLWANCKYCLLYLGVLFFWA